jgi:hypothetical protein
MLRTTNCVQYFSQRNLKCRFQLMCTWQHIAHGKIFVTMSGKMYQIKPFIVQMLDMLIIWLYSVFISCLTFWGCHRFSLASECKKNYWTNLAQPGPAPARGRGRPRVLLVELNLSQAWEPIIWVWKWSCKWDPEAQPLIRGVKPLFKQYRHKFCIKIWSQCLK